MVTNWDPRYDGWNRPPPKEGILNAGRGPDHLVHFLFIMCKRDAQTPESKPHPRPGGSISPSGTNRTTSSATMSRGNSSTAVSWDPIHETPRDQDLEPTLHQKLELHLLLRQHPEVIRGWKHWSSSKQNADGSVWLKKTLEKRWECVKLTDRLQFCTEDSRWR